MRTMRPMQPWPSHFLDDLSRGWRGSSQVLHRPEWWLSLALGAVRCCEELGFKIYQMSNEAKRVVKRFFWSACCLILHDTSWCPMSKMSLSKSQFFRIDVKCSCFRHQLAWSAFLRRTTTFIEAGWGGLENDMKVTLWNEVTYVNAACNLTRNATATSPRVVFAGISRSLIHFFLDRKDCE